MKPKIRFETWKNKRVITIRNDKGQIISRRNQKGSGLKTKQQAYNLYKKNFSLDKKVVRVSRNNPETKNKKINKVILKGKDETKAVNVSGKGFSKAVQIGKNTAIFKTKKPLKNKDFYQFVAVVRWGENSSQTIGYSDIKGTKEQAFNRARQGAIMKGLISYDHEIKFTDKTKGVAYKPNNIVYFEYELQVQTYINTIKNY